MWLKMVGGGGEGGRRVSGIGRCEGEERGTSTVVALRRGDDAEHVVSLHL